MKETLIFAPGCALMLYKPALAEKIHTLLEKNFGKMDMLMTCCQHDPKLPSGSKIINVCPGCDKRFRNDYRGITTISLWEVLAENDSLKLPEYTGKMSIIDACPTREQSFIHDSIRTLLSKMNIDLVEPANTRTRSTCCGDSFYGVIPADKVKELMVKRADEMPADDVVVYCISCIKAVQNGGKNPLYLVDLVFGEETCAGEADPDVWHTQLREYIEIH